MDMLRWVVRGRDEHYVLIGSNRLVLHEGSGPLQQDQLVEDELYELGRLLLTLLVLALRRLSCKRLSLKFHHEERRVHDSRLALLRSRVAEGFSLF